ncbi:hypothetical protein KHQ82_03355 [Mycoplasmatota bacterium]|nr:hypothetical protein KHQ82_03355 [Mycoplasmatota bacterium]
MKNIIKMLGVIVIIFLVTIIAIDKYMAIVPDLHVNKGETNIEVKKVSYCWEALLSGICVDTINPEDMLKGIEPTKVKPGDTLRLDFSKSPDTVRASVYEINQPLDYDIEYGLLKVPEEKGVYIINVLGGWGGGAVPYVLTIEVEGEKVPEQNWINRPQLVYEGLWYLLKSDSHIDIDIDSLELNYIGVLTGEDDLVFKPRDNLESNTHIGYYLFVNKNDTSNLYVYVSPGLTIVEPESLIIFKR